MRRFAFVACMAAVAVLSVWAQQVAPLPAVAVGFRERGKVDVAADATVTQDSPVWVSHEGTLDKVGGGEWVLPPTMVLSPGKTEINVRDGSVTVPAEAGTAPTLTEPTDILNKAVFWVDATRNLVTSNGEDGVDYVLAWKDARETKSAVPFDYPRAVAKYTVTNVPPQVRQNAAGQDLFRRLSLRALDELHRPGLGVRRLDNAAHPPLVYCLQGSCQLLVPDGFT